LLSRPKRSKNEAVEPYEEEEEEEEEEEDTSMKTTAGATILRNVD
jgi:hypothetical protein